MLRMAARLVGKVVTVITATFEHSNVHVIDAIPKRVAKPLTDLLPMILALEAAERSGPNVGHHTHNKPELLVLCVLTSEAIKKFFKEVRGRPRCQARIRVTHPA